MVKRGVGLEADPQFLEYVEDGPKTYAYPRLDFEIGVRKGAGETHPCMPLRYNVEDGTLEFPMNDSWLVTQQVGLEAYFRVQADGVDIEEGKVVAYSGSPGNSGVILGKPALNITNSRLILGIATQEILDGDRGYVTMFGQVRGLNTTGSLYGETWAKGDVLYVKAGVAGGLTNVLPTAPDIKVSMGVVMNTHATNGAILVRPVHLGTLDQLHNVHITSPTDGQYLRYNAATGRWINSA